MDILSWTFQAALSCQALKEFRVYGLGFRVLRGCNGLWGVSGFQEFRMGFLE